MPDKALRIENFAILPDKAGIKKNNWRSFKIFQNVIIHMTNKPIETAINSKCQIKHLELIYQGDNKCEKAR